MQNIRRAFGEFELKTEAQECFQEAGTCVPSEFPFVRFMIITKEEYDKRDDELSHARLCPNGYVLISKARLAILRTSEEKLRLLNEAGAGEYKRLNEALEYQVDECAEDFEDDHTEE